MEGSPRRPEQRVPDNMLVQETKSHEWRCGSRVSRHQIERQPNMPGGWWRPIMVVVCGNEPTFIMSLRHATPNRALGPIWYL